MKKNHFLSDFLLRLVADGKSDPILDSLPVGVEIYTVDGLMLYMNEADARIFGADRDSIIASKVNIFDNPNIPDEVKDAFRNHKEIHKHTQYDFNLVTQVHYYGTGKRDVIHVEYNGRPIVGADGNVEIYVFIIEDITETINREEELRHNTRKTEIAIRDSGIMLWEFDVVRQQFYCDNEPLNGYDRSKPISVQLYTETVHPDDRGPVMEIMEGIVAGRDFCFSFDARILFPDNPEWQYCTINGSPYESNSNGCVIRYVGTRKNNTDIQKGKLLQEKILNSIPLPILIKDNSRYVFCNDESKRMFGISEDKETYDVMEAEHVARIEKTDKEVFATEEPYFGLERVTLKNGCSYDMIVRKSIICDGGRRLLLNIRWDQSLQNELERRAKLLSISMEAINAYSWFFEPDANLISFGEGFDRPGRDVSQLNTLNKFVMSIHPDDRIIFTRTIGRVLLDESGEWNVEYRVDLDGSGNYEWWQTWGLLETTVRNEISYRYMYGMSININSHKQTELTLLRNKEELNNLIRQNELVLNNTNSGLAYITTDYIVQWENISLCSKSLSLEAYKKGELCYKSAYGRTSPCEDCVMQQTIKSRQTAQMSVSLDNQHVIDVIATPVFCEGAVEGIVIRVDDITEREQMIRELRDAREQAEQSDKLKSAFLANMSHEIRTPLNAIVGFSELLVSASDSDDREEYIRIINDNNGLLIKLINDILDLSKIEAGSVELKYEDFDLAEYFDSIALSMQPRVAKNPDVRLVVVNPHDFCNVRLDRNRVAQIFTNYVTNAIKYTPKGFIEMGYDCSEDGIRFYVRDSGIGIPDEKKEKVFHRFEKFDEFAQGTGLGLSICKAIAESMGGSVGFESSLGKGSVFWAFLPCRPEIEEDKKPEISDESVSDAGQNKEASDVPERYKILIVEDIPSNYLLVSTMLKKQYDLIHAENGEQAVDLARGCHPDLILMDMKMPVMDGMKATTAIREFNRDIPIIALTAHAFDADRQAALAVGCNDYLVKPVDRSLLEERLIKLEPVMRNNRRRIRHPKNNNERQ